MHGLARKGVASPVAAVRRPPPSGYRVFIDFDNTITCGDVLDGIIEKFAVDRRWIELEEAWASGHLGAKACLEGQLQSLRAEWPALVRHLETVQFDPGFMALRNQLRATNIELTIVSDNFDRFIGHLLEQRGLADVPFFANHLELADGRLLPSFPFVNPACPDCAHCKKTHFTPRRDARQVVYIGDGRSDLCPARVADVVFAKASLLTTLRAAGTPCFGFEELAGVVTALKEIHHDIKN